MPQVERKARYALNTLIERFGVDAKMPDIIAAISADCPKRIHGRDDYDLCGALVVERLSTE